MANPITQRLEAIRPVTQRLEALLPGGDAGPQLPTSRFQRARVILVASYAVICLLSVLWGLSGGIGDNPIGARVAFGQTSEGTSFITVRNDAAFAWHNVRVEADGRYVTFFANVPAKSNVDARLHTMTNVFRLPRPDGVFAWEAVRPTPPPDEFAAPDYRPESIRILCDEGEHELPVER